MFLRFEFGDLMPQFDIRYFRTQRREELKIQQGDWRNNKRRLDNRNYVLKQLTK